MRVKLPREKLRCSASRHEHIIERKLRTGVERDCARTKVLRISPSHLSMKCFYNLGAPLKGVAYLA